MHNTGTCYKTRTQVLLAIALWAALSGQAWAELTLGPFLSFSFEPEDNPELFNNGEPISPCTGGEAFGQCVMNQYLSQGIRFTNLMVIAAREAFPDDPPDAWILQSLGRTSPIKIEATDPSRPWFSVNFNALPAFQTAT